MADTSSWVVYQPGVPDYHVRLRNRIDEIIINSNHTSKLKKADYEFLAILLGIVIAALVMLFFIAKAVADFELKERVYDKTLVTQDWQEVKKDVIIEKTEPLRPATEEELYDGGFRTKLIEDENGKTCIEKQGEKIFCNK